MEIDKTKFNLLTVRVDRRLEDKTPKKCEL